MAKPFHCMPNGVPTSTASNSGNTADGGSIADQAMTYNAAASLASNSYTKTGYTFTGWNTQGDGSGTAYGDGERLKI